MVEGKNAHVLGRRLHESEGGVRLYGHRQIVRLHSALRRAGALAKGLRGSSQCSGFLTMAFTEHITSYAAPPRWNNTACMMWRPLQYLKPMQIEQHSAQSVAK